MKETPLVDEGLLHLLVCPITGEPLVRVGDTLVGKTYSYKIQDGIPILTKESAIKN